MRQAAVKGLNRCVRGGIEQRSPRFPKGKSMSDDELRIGGGESITANAREHKKAFRAEKNKEPRQKGFAD